MGVIRKGRSATEVSIVMASYNSASTIEAAIASVQMQTFSDWELVVCDDASDDGTADLIQAATARDQRIRMVSSATRSGPAAARNLALADARGTHVALLDADDSLEPNFLESMLSRLGPRTGIVCCDAWMVDGEGRVLGRRSAKFGSASRLDLAGLLRANRIFISILSPRRVIEQAGSFSPEVGRSEDYDLWIRIMELGYEVRYVDAPLVRYRTGGISLSSDRLQMAAWDLFVFERALARGRLSHHERRIARARRDVAAAAVALGGGSGTARWGPLVRGAWAKIVLAST